MNINLEEFILKDIGHTDWYGESNYDRKSSENLDKLDYYLCALEEIREGLILELNNHINYRKGNASAESLHRKAKEIRRKHLIKEFTDIDFDKVWDDEK